MNDASISFIEFLENHIYQKLSFFCFENNIDNVSMLEILTDLNNFITFYKDTNCEVVQQSPLLVSFNQ